MTKQRLTFLLVFALLVAMVAIPAAAQSWPDPGTGSTYTELVNKTAEAAIGQLTYYDASGGVHQGPQKNIPGNGSVAVDPDSVQLPQNFVGAGVVSSNQPLASVVATKWTGGPGDGFQMADYSGVSAGSSKICFPSLFKATPIVASFAVQNTGSAAADIKITYFKRDGTNEGQYTDSIPVGASHTYDLRNPGGAVPNFATGWDGSAVVEVINGQTVAGVGVINQNGRSSTYNAADCAGVSGSTTLVVPSQYRVYNDNGFPNDRTKWHWILLSALNIQNLEGSDASVDVQYIPRNAANNGTTIHVTIPAYSSAGLNTRGGYNGDPSVFDTLGGGWDGTVKVTSNKAVVATVITQWFRGTGPESGYYSAANTSSSATKFFVPGVRRIVSGSNWQQYSAIIIQNIGNSATTVTTKFYDRNGSLVHTYSESIPAGVGVGYNTKGGTGGTSALGDNFEGHAVVESDGQPLAVVLNSITRTPGYATGTTNGIPE